MRFKGDISGLDELDLRIEDKYFVRLIEIGKEAIRIAQGTRGTVKYPKEYLNHTFNLRNAPGYAVAIKGKEVVRNVPAGGEHGGLR